MKGKVILTSVVTIALCLCILTGSTFALFTNSDAVSISVTAGTVKVEAKINSSMRTYTQFDDSTKLTEAFEDITATNGVYDFQNGGTAQLTDNNRKLTLTNIAPGDAVDLVIDVTNTSNIAVKYLVRCQVTTDATTQELVIFVNGAEATAAASNDYRSNWETMGTTENINVTVRLPETVGNTYQGKTAEITFTVYAIQANVTDSAANAEFQIN